MSLFDRALRAIPSGVMTYSKARSSWPAIAPTHLVRGKGAHVWDADGNEYIDLAIGLGAVTLGYQDPDVEMFVADQLAQGPIFSLEHPVTVEVAERLTALFPCSVDGQAKFFKTGSDATTAAVRLARAHTGRDIVLSSGYHGWHSWVVANRTGVAEGEIDAVVPFVFGGNNAEAAAVIVEPETYSAPELRAISSYCGATGTILIFDEVLTGFRVCSGGVQDLTGVTPDLTTVSKALGNGYSVAAVIGRRDVMQTFEKVGVSGTFGGDTIGLAAAKAVIAKTETTDYYQRLWDAGGKMRQEFCKAAVESGVEADTSGYPTHWIPKFAKDDHDVDPIIRDKRARLPWRTLYRQLMCERGFLIGPAYVFSSYALSDYDVERFVKANKETFQVVAKVTDPSEVLVGEAAGPGVRAA